MGLFSFTQEIAIDLVMVENTIIIHNDVRMVDEPSVVCLDKRTDKLIALSAKKHAKCKAKKTKVFVPCVLCAMVLLQTLLCCRINDSRYDQDDSN